VGALTRIAFVAVVTITAFRTGGLEVRYLLPAHTLLLAFAVVGSCLLIDDIWEAIAKRRVHASSVNATGEPVTT
jgi:hypothetical protein